MTNKPDETNAFKGETPLFEQIVQEGSHGKKLRQPFKPTYLPPLWPFVVVAVVLVVIWGVLFLNAPATKDNWHFQFCDKAQGGMKNICPKLDQ
ncbi:hypothetical protein WSS15_08390 [Acetobacter pasteurianus]|uniref:Uncharacterized protein n=3 Tax=Acetobacter pasteurianus TaxID=438 RepID=C7JG27_ACEP3|nr:hypothetical protein [Acetobacter pasteurianus]BAU39569.1 hypothetical protein APT_02487 [Acetobacter pasteurianus NBRC 101655]ASC05843.1 hypothetical protein S101468_01597 [Acetobacter pasteurianus subsp. pasteurianus]CCT59391.1 hypothetical protein APA386B_1302 [Acetobacter pasteurianus 386B]BAI00597.1 hypothetical protein APA01_24910 [Acetobacter pasteurianus IFO 3283-01]BAI03646.1 hypothetical protein APA03_24910 [Acetobacter pasteurianus IFO 3283-03]